MSLIATQMAVQSASLTAGQSSSGAENSKRDSERRTTCHLYHEIIVKITHVDDDKGHVLVSPLVGLSPEPGFWQNSMTMKFGLCFKAL
jgi:hypothetical protein